MKEDLYCKIHIDSSSSKTELLYYIATIVNGKVSLRSVVSTIMEIDVIANDVYDKDKSALEDGFVYYPYYLEVGAIEGTNSSTYFEAIGNMLKEFWSSYNDAIASCDFKDELPIKVT